MKKNFFNLIFSSMGTRFANALFDYTNTIFISNLGIHSSLLMAIYKSSETFINLIFNLVGGVFSDKSNKKIILIIQI